MLLIVVIFVCENNSAKKKDTFTFVAYATEVCAKCTKAPAVFCRFCQYALLHHAKITLPETGKVTNVFLGEQVAFGKLSEWGFESATAF